MALTSATDQDLVKEIQDNIAPAREEGVQVATASTVTLPSRIPTASSPDVPEKEMSEEYRNKLLQEEIGEEIEAAKDPDIAELEGATEMDAPMYDPNLRGYYYEQRLLDYEQKKDAPVTGITTAQGALTQDEFNASKSVQKSILDRYMDEPSTYVKVFGEGLTTGALELAPEIAYQAVKVVPAALEILYNAGKTLGVATANAVIGIVDVVNSIGYNAKSIDHWYISYPGMLDLSFTNDLVKTPADAVKKFMLEIAKPLEETIINDYIGYVPEAKRNFVHDWLGKAGLIAAPLLPMYAGVSMILRAPKLFMAARRAGAGYAKATGKTITGTAVEQTTRGLGVLNSALGAGFAWQAAETFGKGTAIERFAPVLAIPGAVMGASGMIRKTWSIPFGIGLGAIAKVVGAVRGVPVIGEGASKASLRMVAMAHGVPLKVIFHEAKTERDLENAIMLQDNKLAVSYMEDVASGVQSLPKEFRDPIMDNFKEIERLIGKYDGKDGEKLTLFLSQVTGLGIQGAVVKSLAQSEQIGWFRPIKQAKRAYRRRMGVFADVELQAQVYQQQVRILQDNFAKLMQQGDTAFPDAEFKELVNILSKQVDAYADDARRLSNELSIMSDKTAVFQSTAVQREIHDVADEAFGYRDNFGFADATSDTILKRANAFKDRVINLGERAFETAKTLNDAAWAELKGYNGIVDSKGIIDFLLDEKAQGLRRLLKTSKTKAGKRIESQMDLISMSRQASLEASTAERLGVIVQKISVEAEGFGRQLRDPDGNLLDFDLLAKRIKAAPDEKQQKEIYKEFLGSIHASDASLKETIDRLIPPRFFLMDLLSYRSSLLNEYRKHHGNAEGHEIGRLLDVVTEAIDNHALKVKRPHIKEAYDKAIKIYKEEILPWKESLGTTAHTSIFKSEGFEDTLAAEHMFALFTRMKNPNVMVRTFNGMFKDPEDHKEAAKLFQLTIGRILNGDFLGFKGSFITQLDDVQIAMMHEAKMINDEQYTGLKRIIEHKNSVIKATKNTETKQAEEFFQKEVFGPFKKDILNSLGENSPLYKRLKAIENSDQLLEILMKEHIVAIPSLRKIGPMYEGVRARMAKAGPESEEMLSKYDELMSATPAPAEESLTHQIIKVIDDSDLSAFDKYKAYESLDKMLIHKIYTNSFKLTDQRDPTRVVTRQKGIDDKWIAADDSGLLSKVNLPEMAESLEQAQIALKAIAKAKDKAAKLAGINAKHEDTFDSLTEIFSIARMAMSEITHVQLSNIGAKLGMASVLSRVYSVARGVVSLRFVASDAFIRVAHQRKVEYLAEILSNPMAVNTMHDVMVKGRTVTRAQAKYWKGAIAILVGTQIASELKDQDVQEYLQVLLSAWSGEEVPESNMPKRFIDNESVLIPDVSGYRTWGQGKKKP